ncbi:MAG: glycosyltransferase family 10 domain-containing protein [Gammaproteobacteria bacterium]
MTRVNILTIHQEATRRLLRQTAKLGEDKKTALWKGLSFVFNQLVQPNDIVVIYDYPPKDIQVKVASRRQVMHIATEPWDRYPPEFIKQFGMVLSCHPKPADYDGVWINYHGCLDWYYGMRKSNNKMQITLDWTGLSYSPTKTNQRVSIITSKLSGLPGHKARNHFIDILQTSDIPLDIFGQGRQEIHDKIDGLFHYPYHIALENSFKNDYWTEKLADGLLAECIVFYAGCQNIEKYFDKGSIIMLDINNPTAAVDIIKKTMADNLWYKQQAVIKANKKKLMMEENIYPVVLRFLLENKFLTITART